MGLFDRFRRSTTGQALLGAYPVLPTTAAAYGDGGEWGSMVGYGPWTGNGWMLTADEYSRILGLSPAQMWRTQPYLRIVVTFLARNVAQLGLHTFQRIDDSDRQRIRDGFDLVMRHPNPITTNYELIYALIADLALYDRAYWMISPDPTQPLTRIPVPWVQPYGGDAMGPEGYQVFDQASGQTIRLPADTLMAFHGWTPETLAYGSSPVTALREILAEQVQASRYREMVWRRGGKVGAVLTRPADAPDWSAEARSQFKEDWDAQFTGNGPNVGGTPLLEDGMVLSRVDFNAHEMQFIEGSRLALNTVASVYHINPTMIGVLDNANYSNVREFRRMLYGDTLGPLLAQIEDRINTFLIPRFDERPEMYVEFNLEEKLQGSFEEQTAALQASVGRPWMTANEARAHFNMPALEDGDGLVTPLNVLVGGQQSPTAPIPEDPGAQPSSSRPRNLVVLKARITERQSTKIEEVLRAFFQRQRDADRYAHGGEWDGKRWDKELASDLHRVAFQVSTTIGTNEAVSLGFHPHDYDAASTVNFLKAVTANRATTINATTKAQLDDELAKPDGDPTSVYSKASDSRASGIAVGLGTFVAGWATHEAANQIADRHHVEPTKTWITGANPRSEHAEVDGETVPLNEPFSNGSMWPGDGGDMAGCNCSLQINVA